MFASLRKPKRISQNENAEVTKRRKKQVKSKPRTSNDQFLQMSAADRLLVTQAATLDEIRKAKAFFERRGVNSPF